jgi:hypothetical protein
MELSGVVPSLLAVQMKRSLTITKASGSMLFLVRVGLRTRGEITAPPMHQNADSEPALRLNRLFPLEPLVSVLQRSLYSQCAVCPSKYGPPAAAALYSTSTIRSPHQSLASAPVRPRKGDS